MTVQIIAKTFYRGERLSPGALIDVPEDVASRWDKNKIATIEEAPCPDDEGGVLVGRMTTKQLKAKAEELGVDISGATTNKLRAEAILAHIESNGGSEE